MKTKYGQLLSHIEKTMVPPKGQSTYLQGELLRRLWKLVDEAQRNGNMNWDNAFAQCINFLELHLLGKNSPIINKEDISQRLKRLKICGENCVILGSLSEEEAENFNKETVITDDEFYIPLFDAVGLFCEQNPEPIPNEVDPTFYR